MKIDCSNTVNFFKERTRMTNECKINCENCPMSFRNNGVDIGCNSFVKNYTEQAVEIVQKWSDEHPQKTRLEDLKEKYPKAVVNIIGGKPDICVKTLGYGENPKGCGHADKCVECWNMPV